LPVQERIRLVELIRDSVAALPETVEILPALKAELEARLAEFETNPEAGYGWDQVKSYLQSSNLPQRAQYKPAGSAKNLTMRTKRRTFHEKEETL
ncbi:MAG: addiction module protein, partial [Chlorobium sp.]